MEILVHSFLDKARQLNASLHIRYSARPLANKTAWAPPGRATPSEGNREQASMNSYVIIHKEYSYLEPIVRSMFEGAKDVTVFLDRRAEDRPDTSPTTADHPTALERRCSKPMLEIIISVPSGPSAQPTPPH